MSETITPDEAGFSLPADIQARVDEIDSKGREVPFGEVEARADGDKIVFQGHAAVFDRMSEDLGGFRERIQRGAFRRVLDAATLDVRFLFNHDSNYPMARSTVMQGPGMLELREDPKGLRVYAELVPTSMAQDIRLLVQSGVVSQMSFAFSMENGVQTWEETDGGLVRTIVKFGDIFDVCPVVFPAYRQTDAAMRAVESENADELLELGMRDLAWKIHRGEQSATDEERAAIDAALARRNTVSPWMAERAFRAVSQEPELLASIPGKTATVVLEDAAPDETAVHYRLVARQRRLRALEKTITTREQR